MTDRPYWLGAGVIIFGLVWLYQAMSLPQFVQYQGLGAGFIVTLVGGILVLLGLLLTWQIWRGEKFEAQEGEDVDVAQAASWPALIWTFAGVAVPIAIMPYAGFPITAAIGFALVARGFGSRRVVIDLALGLVIGLACFFGFSALGVNLGDFLPIAGIEWKL
ncbi:membrane protein [Agaricicola taiwanensis]|uniref:Membrane protein n=1 Tax=Agaricicola taiwanensis TaxID=591372 RepID=A0A8J3DYU5_9RHOB|nr:tripartite tricarboxylate transporter TctB family protein [Agaricicola taiwanensis]GGE50513.1 membrane protein [Agaricicola taiwanensis]